MESTTSSDSFFGSINGNPKNSNVIIIILIIILVVIYFFSKYTEHMSGGTLTQLFAQDAQDIYLKGNVDQLATGNFMLYWNQPTRVASGYSWGNGVPNRGQLVSTIPPVQPNNTARYGMDGQNDPMTLNVNLVEKPGESNESSDLSRFEQDVNAIQNLESANQTQLNPYANPPIRVREDKPNFVNGDLVGYSGKTGPGTWGSYDVDQRELQKLKPNLQKLNEKKQINQDIKQLNKLDTFDNLADNVDSDADGYSDANPYNELNNGSIIPARPGTAGRLAQMGQIASCPCMDGNCHNCLRCRMIDCPNCRLGRCPNCVSGNCPLCKLNQKREQGINTSLPCVAGGQCGFPPKSTLSAKSCSTCIQPVMSDDLVGIDYSVNMAPGGSKLGENLIADELDEIAGVGQMRNNITTNKMNNLEPFTMNKTTKQSKINKLGEQYVCECMHDNNYSGCPTCSSEIWDQDQESANMDLNNNLTDNFDNVQTNKLAINVGGQLVCADKSGNCGLSRKNTGIFTNSQDNSSKSGCLSCAHRAVALNGDLFCPCVNGNCDSCEKCKAGLCTQCPKEKENFVNINQQPNYAYPNSNTNKTKSSAYKCDCMRSGCPLCSTANDMSIDLPSFGTWHGGYRLANGWNEATPGLNPVNLTDSLVYYPDSYVGSYFTNPKPDIMKPYPFMPANEPVSNIVLGMQ
jgi:hypothetical protein